MRDLPPLSGVIIAVPIGLLMWACLALLVWGLWHVPAVVWGFLGHLVVLGAGVWVTVACLVRAGEP